VGGPLRIRDKINTARRVDGRRAPISWVFKDPAYLSVPNAERSLSLRFGQIPGVVGGKLDAGDCSSKTKQEQAGCLNSNKRGPADPKCWPFSLAQQDSVVVKGLVLSYTKEPPRL
jgi:hypothetical protein